MHKQCASMLMLLFAGSAWTPAFAQRYDGHHGFWDSGWGWGHMLFGALGMILFWTIVIALVILLVRWLGGARGDAATGRDRPTALEILNARYAKGEIDRDEYGQRKHDLEN